MSDHIRHSIALAIGIGWLLWAGYVVLGSLGLLEPHSEGESINVGGGRPSLIGVDVLRQNYMGRSGLLHSDREIGVQQDDRS